MLNIVKESIATRKSLFLYLGLIKTSFTLQFFRKSAKCEKIIDFVKKNLPISRYGHRKMLNREIGIREGRENHGQQN